MIRNQVSKLFVSLTVIFLLLPIRAQSQDLTFSLPDAHEGTSYKVNITEVLRDKYRLKVETGSSASPVLRWRLKRGDLPPGLILQEDSVLIGTPNKAARTDAYNFQVEVTNKRMPKEDPLIISFTLTVLA